MAFLDSSAGAADEAETAPPSPAPPGGRPPPGGPAGGGPILASIANRQRGPQVSAPGQGDMGQSITMIQNAYALFTQALPGLPSGSPLQLEIARMLPRLSRHLPAGSPAIGQQQTQANDMVRNLKKNALLQMIMSQLQPQQGRGGGPPGAGETGGGGPAGAMAQAPMPSTPLPGA